MENKPKMQLVMQMGSGYGIDQGAWRMPNADPAAYMNIDVHVELAKIAERGKIQMIFFADTPALTNDISNQPPPVPNGSHYFIDSVGKRNGTNWFSCDRIYDFQLSI